MTEHNLNPETEMTAEEASKDRFFNRITVLSEEMTAAHGRDFAMGALVLAARWISEHKLGSPQETDEI